MNSRARLKPQGLREWLFALVRIAVILVVLVFGALMFFQEKLIFFPTTLSHDFQFSFARPCEEKFLTAGADKFHALYFPSDLRKGVILYFHGNGGALDMWGEVAQELVDLSQMSVLMIDYPGYGKSPGAISSEEQLHEIAKAAFKEAKGLAGGAVPLVIFGRSIGTGLATRLAAEHPDVAALVLETPYLSLRTLAEEHYPWAPLFLLKYPLRSDLELPKIRCPILILHGTRDEIIPFAHGKSLSALGKSVTFVEIPGGHHNDLSAFEPYAPALKKFLDGNHSP